MTTNLRQRKLDNLSREEIKSSNDDVKRETVAAQGWGAFAIAFAVAVILVIVVLILIPSPIEPVAFSFPDPPDLTGPLVRNEKLSKTERLHENEIIGPESIVIDGEHIYTGTLDGKILVIYKGTARVLAKLGQDPCGGFENEPTCGRPLGMRLDNDGYLVVVDAYLGLFKVNVATGDVHQLYSSSEPINGKIPKFLNDLDIAKDGTIYVTDSSTKWDRRHNRYVLLEAESSGRLLSYNPQTKHMTQLVGGLMFPNGVQLSIKEDVLLISETTTARIMRYYLQGEKKGELDVFVHNLPGFPDNIRRSSRGTYWIGLAGVRFKARFNGVDFMASKPLWRAFFAKVLPQEMLMLLLPKYGLILELDKTGKIIQSLHDPTGRQSDASEIEEKNGVLYIGSYHLSHLGRLYMMAV
ncbi:adipocyte plasma membrane-associated protein-like [Gigantopelta aegis]|uniref:adipocyte plasma membrane-associated protein-like n=1 Tax=Gigantopelta aegis TaxID=1735272 RepID=UPI001B88CA05|nr:adipocyte plasma membrane-associated protein-like [Gigantopelta aegis]